MAVDLCLSIKKERHMYARPSCLSRKIPATKAGTKRAEEQSSLSTIVVCSLLYCLKHFLF